MSEGNPYDNDGENSVNVATASDLDETTDDNDDSEKSEFDKTVDQMRQSLAQVDNDDIAIVGIALVEKGNEPNEHGGHGFSGRAVTDDMEDMDGLGDVFASMEAYEKQLDDINLPISLDDSDDDSETGLSLEDVMSDML